MSKFSILLLDKKEGETSFRSLGAVKREFRGSKVGHAGTLDKFATGLMLVLTGEATKLNPLFSGMDKSYRASIRFGSETDTLDPEGEVIAEANIPSLETVENVVRSFVGTQSQLPPIYSAIHVDGKRAYQSARSGQSVDMPSRTITVYSAELISYSDGLAVVDFHVSKGTYIRSLARDIGLKANSRAHLENLDRFTLGPFSKADIGKSTEELLEKLALGRMDFSKDYRKTLINGYLDKKGIKSLSDGSSNYYMIYIDDEFTGIIQKENGKYSIIALKSRE
ncbi:MAG: tRNA pseudouridine(55) synthase TruB [Sphaerochaetaceae bacterium]|nr:tRNA pseudouridine(55) synthase TruB [Sphaerochaetaceae bacterium]